MTGAHRAIGIIKRKGILRVGTERVSVPTPWVVLGDKDSRVSVTLALTNLELGLKPFRNQRWIRMGVLFSRTFTPRWGWCRHWQYRGIVRRTALGFGFGGLYLLRMPNQPALIQEDDQA